MNKNFIVAFETIYENKSRFVRVFSNLVYKDPKFRNTKGSYFSIEVRLSLLNLFQAAELTYYPLINKYFEKGINTKNLLMTPEINECENRR